MRNRVFVLGAGFSRAAGIPLAKELWQEVYRRSRTLTGRAAKFHEDLETYIEYKKNCDGHPEEISPKRLPNLKESQLADNEVLSLRPK